MSGPVSLEPVSRTTKVLALASSSGLTTVVALLTGMVMTRLLTPVDLATYRQSVMAFDVAIPLLSFNLKTAVYYYLPTESERTRGLFLDGVIVMLTAGLFYALFISLGGSHVLASRFSNPDLARNLIYLAPLPLFLLPATLTDAVLVVQNRILQQVLLSLVTNSILAIGLISACFIWATPDAVLKTRCLIGALAACISIVIAWHALPKDRWAPQLSGIKKVLLFSLPLAFAGGVGAISQQLDKLVVASLCSPLDFAIYSTGAIDIPFAGMITGAAMSVIHPELRRSIAAGDKLAAVRLFSSAALRTSAWLLPIAVFLFVVAEPLMILLFSEKYADSATAFRLYLLRTPMKVVVFATLMTSLGLNRAILLRATCALIATTLLSGILVRNLGPTGSITASLISLYLIEGIWCISVIAKEAGCHWKDVLPFSSMLAVLAVSAIAAVAAACCLPWATSAFGYGLGMLVAGLAYFISLAFVAKALNARPLLDEFSRTLRAGRAIKPL
jgi:O-antigen/teichoic acid export membrane protein